MEGAYRCSHPVGDIMLFFTVFLLPTVLIWFFFLHWVGDRCCEIKGKCKPLGMASEALLSFGSLLSFASFHEPLSVLEPHLARTNGGPTRSTKVVLPEKSVLRTFSAQNIKTSFHGTHFFKPILPTSTPLSNNGLS